MNRKASGVLLNCVDTETEAGEAAFNIVEQFIDSAGGYAGGHFPKAWKAMVNRYEDQDTVVTERISLSLSILFGTEQVTSGKGCYRKI